MAIFSELILKQKKHNGEKYIVKQIKDSKKTMPFLDLKTYSPTRLGE